MYFPQDNLWTCFPANTYTSNSTIEGQMINGVPDGHWTHFRDNGYPYIITEWQNTQPIKTWTFYSNGKIKHFAIIGSDGIMKIKYFDNNHSTLISELTIKDGHVRGQLKIFYPNSQLKAKGQTHKTYDKDGNLTDTFTKSGLWKFYNEEESLTHELTYKDGLVDGHCRFYDNDGIVISEGRKIGKDNVGIWKIYSYDDDYQLFMEDFGPP